MSARLEELAWSSTPMGEITLRRRQDPEGGDDIYEVKLDDDFLMSSQYVVAEVEVARLALAALPGADLEVVVGGLGLGYTAQTVLDDARVRSLVVVEALPEVIDWHERGLLPVSVSSADPRCTLQRGDFFALVGEGGFDPADPERLFDAVVVDIDHSPRHVLHPSHSAFYSVPGLDSLARRLKPGGVFTLWSNDPPDDTFVALLREVFANVDAQVVAFPNPLQDREATNTVYLAGAVLGIQAAD